MESGLDLECHGTNPCVGRGILIGERALLCLISSRHHKLTHDGLVDMVAENQDIWLGVIDGNTGIVGAQGDLLFCPIVCVQTGWNVLA
jgi:hypothetical protein